VKEDAWKLFSSHGDKDYDLIDCISFSMMGSYGIREAFGFDRQFLQRGFRLRPE
jgi:predicted nucleic acid-binding protein